MDSVVPGRPAHVAAFRRLWLLTIVTNMTALVQTVAAAWLMTRIGTPSQVALIQSAIAVPVMVFSLFVGALADMADRRRLILISCALMLVATAALSVMSVLDAMRPGPLLWLCVVFGCGNALFGPTGMASVGDYLPRTLVPDGVASLGVAFNLARVLGPAVGGVLIGSAGLTATFIINMVACAAMVALQLGAPESRAKPSGQNLTTTFVAGIVFATRDLGMRIVMARAGAFSAAASTVWALLPLVSRDQLHGSSSMFGLLMSAMGAGAILCTWQLARARRLLSAETILRIAAGTTAVGLVALPFTSHWLAVAMLLVPVGAAWVATLTLFNISVQLFTPAEMAGRAIGAFYTAIFGGLAFGSWAWGALAEHTGLDVALIASGLAVVLTGLAGLRWPPPTEGDAVPGRPSLKGSRA